MWRPWGCVSIVASSSPNLSVAACLSLTTTSRSAPSGGGSWNRTVPIGYRVMFVGLGTDGRPRAAEVFAAGWLRDGVAVGRPVDLLELPDGSMLVSDDKGGRIYRISYGG